MRTSPAIWALGVGATAFVESLEPARFDDAALRDAQQAKDGVRAYELGYAALGAR